MATPLPLRSQSLLPRKLNSSTSISSPPPPRSFHFCRPSASKLQAFFNPIDDPIVKEALKEPVAFASGMLAGFLRLDLKEDPLKEWLTRTVQAAGIATEEVDEQGVNLEEGPQEIEIE